MLGLYLHIPFCSSICNYCNFNRGLFDEALKTRYVDALRSGDRERAGRGEPADTIFFGGGTPSLLEPGGDRPADHRPCREAFDVDPDAEITLETNPETSIARRLDALPRGRRQSRQLRRPIVPRRRARSGSDGSIRPTARATRCARRGRAGFDNVSLDLMMWLPQQTRATWQESVEALIDVGPDHASLYLLELYPNAPLKEDMARAGLVAGARRRRGGYVSVGLDRLDAAGYGQYEISNVARPGRESRHNLKYWQDGEWLGFRLWRAFTRDGIAVEECRRHRGLHRARRRPGATVVAERRRCRRRAAGGSAVHRPAACRGVDVAGVGQRYGMDAWARFGAGLAPFIAAGGSLRDGDRLRLTREGMLIANEVMAVFV